MMMNQSSFTEEANHEQIDERLLITQPRRWKMKIDTITSTKLATAKVRMINRSVIDNNNSISIRFLIKVWKDDEEEDDVEEEMISLEQERIRRARSHLTIISAEPSASNASSACIATSATAAKHHNRDDDDQSLRRTPGAIQMHLSSRTELLGFGLALTTPLAGGHRKDRHSPASRPPRDPSNINSSSNLAHQNRREDLSYTPASYALTKNPHIQVSHGAFSPNTLRLTEDLDNLLDEEDEELRHQFFQEGEDAETSWTKRYIFESEGGTAEHTRIGKKNRRHFLMDQHQPHHLRRQDGTRSNDDEVPQPLNFEGAFAPPSDRGIFQRPVPSSAPNDPPFRRPIPSSSQNDPIAFSTGSKSFVPPHQTFNPHVFAPHPQVHHGPHVGYSLSSSSDMSNQSLATSMGGLSHLGYEQQSHRMASSFVPPNSYVLSQQQHRHHQQQQHPSQQLPHGVEWASMMMSPNSASNNGSHYANHMPPPPLFAMPTQQQQQQHLGGWGQDMETPWMDTNAFGYGLISHQNHMPPNPHMYSQPTPHVYSQPQLQQNHHHHQQQQHHQQQHHQPSLYWNDAQNLGYEARCSPTAQSFEPSQQEAEPFDSGDGQLDNVDPSKINRRESRLTLKRTVKKPIKTPAIVTKVDKLPRNINKKTPPISSSTPSPSNAKVNPVVPSAVAVTSKRIVKGRKTDEDQEDPGETKRAELVESPETRAAFKEFYRNFRLNERSSIQEAKEYALKALETELS
ncbi:hypothetical protein MHU86_19507 [Fragilaria crotonensis]|nr:hypothetical protein MHU86_19507 [Fragilaria crotonensis]